VRNTRLVEATEDDVAAEEEEEGGGGDDDDDDDAEEEEEAEVEESFVEIRWAQSSGVHPYTTCSPTAMIVSPA
jgi:hypothetical protein